MRGGTPGGGLSMSESIERPNTAGVGEAARAGALSQAGAIYRAKIGRAHV